MATVRTVSVKSSGGDYTSLNSAEAGEQADLPTLDRQLNIECYSMEDTTQVVIDGWTTDATRYISIYTPTPERHDGKWNTSKARLVVSVDSDGAIRISENFVRLTGLQIHNTKTSPTTHCAPIYIYQTGTTDIRVDTCILRGGRNLVRVNGPANLYIINCIGYGATVYGVIATGSHSSGTISIYSSTLSAGTNGVNRDAASGGTVTCKNVYSSGSTAYSGTIGMTTCASSDATGSVGLQNIAYNTTQFVNVTGGSEDLHLAGTGSALYNVGTDTSSEGAPLNFTVDIDGVTRSGTWDIGADEYVASLLALEKTLSDNLESSDALINTIGLLQTLEDTAELLDAKNELLSFEIAESDTLDIQELIEFLSSYLVDSGDILVLSEELGFLYILLLSQEDTLDITEALDTSLLEYFEVINTAISDLLELTDLDNELLSYLLASEDVVTLTDELLEGFNYFSPFEEALELSDAAEISFVGDIVALSATIGEAMTMGDISGEGYDTLTGYPWHHTRIINFYSDRSF